MYAPIESTYKYSLVGGDSCMGVLNQAKIWIMQICAACNIDKLQNVEQHLY
jgi:hypothetical protein